MLQIDDTSDGIRCIGLDRASKRNAIGVEMTLAMQQVLMRSRTDSDIHTLVFHGIGDNFSAGMDMKDFFDASTRTPDELRRARAATDHWRTRLLHELPQIVISAVQGYCLGGALPILAASDLVFASQDATFGLPEINFGFVPGGQIVKSVAEVMTARGVAYAALTGRPIDARRARQWGLVTAVVDGNPLDHAMLAARTIAARGAETGGRFQKGHRSPG